VITAAEAAVSGLNADSQAIGLEAVGPLLLRSEAIASSRVDHAWEMGGQGFIRRDLT